MYVDSDTKLCKNILCIELSEYSENKAGTGVTSKEEIMSITKKEALAAVDREKELLCNTSDAVWDHAETAFQEFESAKILEDALVKEGFQLKTNLANIETAFSGTYGHGKPVIGILGEFDALSGLSQVSGIVEEKALVPGAPGHGCGHNLLGTGSLAAAIAVKEYLEKNNKEGTVIYFGCPAEEGGSGKGFMARDGVFDELDCAITWHPGDNNIVTVGSSNANYQIFYRFYGKASHAAACPELGRSGPDAVELMNTGVQYLREHVIPEARMHYAITNAGGYSPNVVQPFGEVLYLLRAPQTTQVQEIYERVNDIAKGAALMTGTRVEMQFVKACSNLVDNTTLEEVLQNNLYEVERYPYTAEEMQFSKEIHDSYGGLKLNMTDFLSRYEKSKRNEMEDLALEHKDDILNDYIVPLQDNEKAMAGSTDVGDVSWVCPTAQINAVTIPSGTPGHSWQIVSMGKTSVAHKGMMYAGKVMAAAIIDLLENPELIEKAKVEHKKRLGGGSYVAPIPKDVRPMSINPSK